MESVRSMGIKLSRFAVVLQVGGLIAATVYAGKRTKTVRVGGGFTEYSPD